MNNYFDEKGRPLNTRVTSALQAQTMFYLWKDAGRHRREKAAVIEGMFNGNPPYRRDKKRAAGQNWQANFNTLEAASRKDSAKVPYYDLFSSTKNYFSIRTKKDNPAGLTAEDASRKMTEIFDEVLKNWNALESNLWTMLDDFIKFNKGFFWWPRVDTWRFRRIPWHRVYFPDGYTVDVDEWEEFAIEHVFPVVKLWSLVKDESVAKAAGWNRDVVIDAIKKAVPNWQEDDSLAVQERLNASTLDPNCMAATVQAASVFTQELDGTWTRMVIPVFKDGSVSNGKSQSMLERQTKNPETKISETDWMFFKKDVAKDVSELLAPFFFEVNEGSLNALEGLGKRIISMVQVKDRIANKIADNTLLRQGVLLQARDSSTRAKTGLVQLGGGVNVIPPGYEAQQGQIFGDVEAGLAVNRDFDARLDVNTGIYRPQFEKPAGNPESATAASIRFNQATVLTNSAVNRFMIQLDRLGVEIFRRMTMKNLPSVKDAGIRAAKDFQRRLAEEGVSREQIEDVIKRKSTTAVRSVGNGSPVMRQQALGALTQVVPMMGQRGLRNFQDDYVAAFAGIDKVERYFPDDDRERIPLNDDWQATRENNDMQQGAPPLLVDGQDHEVHVMHHIQAGFSAVEAVNTGADPQTSVLFFQLALPHIEEHIQLVGRPDKQKDFSAALSQLQQQAEAVMQLTQEQQQQQQNLTFEQQLRSSETQAKIEDRDRKTQQQMQQKAEKHQQDMTIQNQKTLSEIRAAEIKAALKTDNL